MAPRPSGRTSIFGGAFLCVSKFHLGIERQKKLNRFANLLRILMYPTWPIWSVALGEKNNNY